MEAKEILQKVKQYFADLTAPVDPMAAPVAEPKEYELKDGGKVMIDVLEVGGIVMIDGAPALPGDMELVDGSKMTIGDNGVITVIELAKPVETEDEILVDPAMEMATKFAAFETATSEKFAAYETKFAEYETKLKKATKVIDELLKLSQLIVDAPSVEADNSVRTSNTFKEQKKDFSILFN
jgi:hypothetical protein